MTLKRIVFVQEGNYAEAEKRFSVGGDETFFAQRYSVEYVASLVSREDVEDVTQICFSEDLEEERLPSGVLQLGLIQWPEGAPHRTSELVDLVLAQNPTHLITNTPSTPLIRTARDAGIDVFPLLADSFRVSGLKAKLRYWWLGHNLKHPKIRWVTNHNLNASEDIARIGVPRSKIVPFDWPAVVSPEDFEPKTSARDPRAPRLLYVGQVREDKGVGDLIDTTAQLIEAGRDSRLTVIGAGDVEALRSRASERGIAEKVSFLGKLAHQNVMTAMNDHDVVLIPSWHEYPEGLPNTIYEGLCSRTPLVVSDHPMFGTRVKDEQDCLVFPSKNVNALVNAVERLLDDPTLYAALSANAEAACEKYLVGAPWSEIISHWLGGTPEDDAWLAERALSSERFRS